KREIRRRRFSCDEKLTSRVEGNACPSIEIGPAEIRSIEKHCPRRIELGDERIRVPANPGLKAVHDWKIGRRRLSSDVHIAGCVDDDAVADVEGAASEKCRVDERRAARVQDGDIRICAASVSGLQSILGGKIK